MVLPKSPFCYPARPSTFYPRHHRCFPLLPLFLSPPHTPFSNLVRNYVSDPSRIVKQGFYRNGRDSSPNHTCTQGEQSDTDDEHLPQTRVECPSPPVIDITESSDDSSILEPLSEVRRKLVDQAAPSPTSAALPSSPTSPRKQIFLKSQPGAKSGSPVYFDITDKIASSTPHTYTLTSGQVVRKNFTRTSTPLPPPSPKRGTFGTPCKLEYCRAFVHPETTRVTNDGFGTPKGVALAEGHNTTTPNHNQHPHQPAAVRDVEQLSINQVASPSLASVRPFCPTLPLT